jgi:N-acetylmuramoyl-L-alanine amidase
MIVVSRPSPNHGPRPEGERVELLVLHYTGMPTAGDALARLTDPASGVSAHYTVDEDGTVYAHVAEERRAWHAGVSQWRGRSDVNSRSVGVEIVNPGHEFGYRPFPAVQMEAVAELCRGILARHRLAPRAVVAHSDVAPSRKQDPGELFDWPWLAARGVGAWPEPVAADLGPAGEGEVAALLARIGYDAGEPLALTAFQRRYRREAVTGVADEDTVARLRAVARAG